MYCNRAGDPALPADAVGSIAGRTMQDSVYSPNPRRSVCLPTRRTFLIVLIDDVGPALPSTFGGEINTPTMDRIAKEGIAYNRFHTTAMCSPTRAALLTGRNHHRVGNGQIAELANDWDGYAGVIPKSSATVAEVLKDYGYTTAAFGKWHNTPAEQTTAPGPFDYWPTGYGFEYFYGFLAGEASQYEPSLVRNTTRVEPPTTPEEGYHLSEDLADDAIDWLRSTRRSQPDKPFFMYWASGAVHGPHHVLKEWADKYKGKFDDGWDDYRERAFERAKAKGWIPADARTHAAAANMPSWDSIPEAERPFQRRLMEVYAGFTEHVDVQVGRARGRGRAARLRRQHARSCTSGATTAPRPKGQNGTISELLAQNGIPSTIDQHIKALENSAASTCWARPRPTTCTTPAGPGRAARPTRARSWWPRTSAAPATRWPSAGRRRSSPTQRRGPVPPRQRHRADDLRDPRHHPAAGGQRHSAGPDRRRQLGLHVQRREGQGSAAHAVLRGHGQPLHLPRRVDGVRLRPAHAVGAGPAEGHPGVDARQGQVGALQPRRGLVAGQRPGRQDAGEARRR